MALLALNGSPSAHSKTGTLAEAAVRLAGGGVVHHVAELPADALLLRGRDEGFDALLGSLASARPLVLATPVYRATYTGLLKLVLDQVPNQPDQAPPLAGVPVVLVGTGGNRDHFLSLDAGLRGVVTAMGGWAVPTVVYGTGADFADDGQPSAALVALLQQALDEAARLA